MVFRKSVMTFCLLLMMVALMHPAAAEGSGTAAGYLYSWGNNANNQTVYPDDQNPVAVSTGAFHSLALRSDGRLVAWGDDTYGQTQVPDGNDFSAIAAGGYHNIALRANGSLVGWGRNNFNQTRVPAGNDYIAISSGVWHSVALRSDHSLVAWGNNDYGQTDVPPGNDFIAVSAGGCHSLALRTDGSIVAWGQTGLHMENVPAGNDFVAVSAGWYHNLALRSNGSVTGWGMGYNSLPMPEGNDYSAISAGGYHGILLRNDGVAIAYGWNRYDQTGEIHGVDVRDVAAGYTHNVILYKPLDNSKKDTAAVIHPVRSKNPDMFAVNGEPLAIEDDVSPRIWVNTPLSPGHRIFGYEVPWGCTVVHDGKNKITRVYGPDRKEIFWAYD